MKEYGLQPKDEQDKVQDEYNIQNVVKFGCNLCPNKCSTYGKIYLHMKNAHKDSLSEPLIQIKVEDEQQEVEDQKIQIDQFECKQCPNKYSTLGEIERHTQSEHEVSPYQCDNATTNQQQQTIFCITFYAYHSLLFAYFSKYHIRCIS